jgi:hypothetical protein
MGATTSHGGYSMARTSKASPVYLVCLVYSVCLVYLDERN